MASLIPSPPQFDYEPDGSENFDRKWTVWLRRFNIWMTSTELSKKSDKIQITTILAVPGPRVEKVFESNKVTGTKIYKDAVALLTTHSAPKKDIVFSTVKFRQLAQMKQESIAQFVQRLRVFAVDCEF